ncbi:MAG: electron transfer flavoprotein subunit beta/FixA family protein [Chloroflexota bacterium]|nr:electron transfer flavoprotein subunit beta/FixA family protein [Chloroflexota bacterium]
MNIVVPIKMVPDLVEELIIDESGTALDITYLRLKLNEFDDHAVEQAILLKESGVGSVTVVAPDMEGVDEALYTAAAKGADRLIKLTGHFGYGVDNHALARVFANAVKTLRPELILTGVQAHNDLDGPVGPRLAEHLGMPYVGYVAGVAVSDGEATVRKELPGGVIAETTVTVPAVLGVQAAAKPPRYVPISRVRQTMRTAIIEKQPAAELEHINGPLAVHLSQPDTGQRATMLEGDVDEIAANLVEIFKQQGVL